MSNTLYPHQDKPGGGVCGMKGPGEAQQLEGCPQPQLDTFVGNDVQSSSPPPPPNSFQGISG